MEGASLNMKPPHQSLPNLVPHGERGNLQEIPKSLLSQKLGVPLMGPKSKHQPEKSGPSTPTTELVNPLHPKLEAIC